MNDPAGGGQFVPVTRVELRRSTLLELCRSDDELRGCPLMSVLTAAEAEWLLGAAVARRFQENAAVYREGDEGQSLFLVLGGEVQLSASGGSVVFAVARKGDVFGEAELVLSRWVRATSALASGHADVVELPAGMLKDVGRSNARLVEQIQRLHASRHAATQELAEFLNRW